MSYTTLVVRDRQLYKQRWDQNTSGLFVLVEEERVPAAYETDPDRYFGVACRLCGEVWSLPRSYEAVFKDDHSWECPHCRREMRELGRESV